MSVVRLVELLIFIAFYTIYVKKQFFSLFKIEVIIGYMWYTDVTYEGLCILWNELLLILVALSHIWPDIIFHLFLIICVYLCILY